MINFSRWAQYLQFASFVPYIAEILGRRRHPGILGRTWNFLLHLMDGKGPEAKPNRPWIITWTLYMMVDGITAMAMYRRGELNGQMTGVVIGVIIVFLLTLYRGQLKGTALEVICIVLAIPCFIQLLHHNELRALLGAQALNIVATMPTIKHVLKHPREESRLGWLLGFLASCCQTAALGDPRYWTAMAATQPLTFLFLTGILTGITWFRRSSDPA